MRALLAGLALSLAAPVSASDPVPWRAVDTATGRIQEVPALEALAPDFPDSSSVRLRLLNAQLGAGDVDAVIESLRWLKERGYVFSAGAQAQLPELLGEEHAATARELLTEAPETIEASEAYTTIPAEAGLIEGLFASDPYGTLVATSVTGKSIHLFLNGEDGWTSISVPGANDLSGLVGEPDDSMGWAASANLDESVDAEPAFTGLMGLRRDFQNPVLVPAPESAKAVSDLTIGPDSTVYASDPIGGGVYHKPIGAVELEELVAPGTLRSPQGLAVSADGAKLYVSDYRYGLAMVDLADGSVERLASDVPAILDGIDALWRHGDHLIAVQNGLSPMRIIALKLSEDGSRITGHSILEQAHSQWTEPLGGSIAGDTLYYVATGQWDRYEKGEPRPENPPIPTQIRRLDLSKLSD